MSVSYTHLDVYKRQHIIRFPENRGFCAAINEGITRARTPYVFPVSYTHLDVYKRQSIIIPNKDHAEDLRRCISSIIEKSTYDNYEIVVVENNSETKEIFSYYEELKNNPSIRVVTYEGEFNYSAINNLGVSCASGDYVLLLNNDTQVITVNWMEELLMYAQRQDVGAVGGKLYYGDKTIRCV